MGTWIEQWLLNGTRAIPSPERGVWLGVIAGREVEEGLLKGADTQRGAHAREQCRADKRRILQVEAFIISQHAEGQPRILLIWTSQFSFSYDTVTLHVVAWLRQCHAMVLCCYLLPFGH